MSPNLKTLTLLLAAVLAPYLAAWGQLGGPTIAGLEEKLKEDPEDPAALYNLGLLNYLNGDPAEALPPWRKLKELEPDNWKLRAKLIQAYSACGKKKEREKEIGALRSLRSGGEHPDLVAAEFFIRDQFVAGGVRVYVLDYYDMDADWHLGPLAWKFYLTKNGEKLDWFISLGSYDATTEFARAKGKIKEDERAYHLDGYGPDGSHQTYAIFDRKPDYDWTRQQVVKILEGKLKAASGTQPEEEASESAPD